MMFGCALRFVGAQREAVCELFAGGEMAFRLAHWHWYFPAFLFSAFSMLTHLFWFHSSVH